MDNPEAQGEFHHFQLVDSEGRIPVSVSILVHYNYKRDKDEVTDEPQAISEDEIIDFHYALKGFDGNFVHAFRQHN
jgi:hypothetical protein